MDGSQADDSAKDPASVPTPDATDSAKDPAIVSTPDAIAEETVVEQEVAQPVSGWTDAELIDEIRNERPCARQALEVIYTRYYGVLVYLFGRWGTVLQMPEDLAHEFFLKVQARPGNLATYDTGRPFRSYLRRIAYHLWLDKEFRKRRGKLAPLTSDDQPDGRPQVLELVLEGDFRDLVREAIRTHVKPNARRAIELCLFDERTPREIAVELRCQQAAIYPLLVSARKSIIEFLRKRDYDVL